jgi:hypothetical protein
MRTRLDEALERLGTAKDYAEIDADTFAESDLRRGYGTPTVLYDNRDLFGMPEPMLPCRLLPDGSTRAEFRPRTPSRRHSGRR